MMFNARNWYWGPFGGQYYSSATQKMVDPNDATFLAWQQGGGAPTPWPKDIAGNATREAMQDVLSPYGLFVDLIAYANARQWMLATGGYTATIGGGQHFFKTDPESLGLITSKAVRLGQPNAPTTIDWQFDDTTWATFSAVEFMSTATQIADFVQSTFDTLKQVVAGCLSSPATITTREQVDSWAWPASHS